MWRLAIRLSPLRVIYLALAILGAWAPAMALYDTSIEGGIGVLASHADWPLGSFLTDPKSGLLVASVSLIIWVVAETRVRKNWPALWVVPVTFLIGPGCGLPLYLFLRTRPI